MNIKAQSSWSLPAIFGIVGVALILLPLFGVIPVWFILLGIVFIYLAVRTHMG